MQKIQIGIHTTQKKEITTKIEQNQGWKQQVWIIITLAAKLKNTILLTFPTPPHAENSEIT
jgi:hypothetical protein